MEPKAVPATWPAKGHFGTIWVYRGGHPGLTHNFFFFYFPPVFQPTESTQICSQKWKHFCASRRAPDRSGLGACGPMVRVW